MASKLNLREINEAIRLIRKDLGEVSKTPFLSGQLKEANSELVKLRASFQEAGNDLRGWSDSLNDSINELTKTNYVLTMSKKSFKGLVSIADQFNQIQEDGLLMDQKKINRLRAQGKQHERNLEYAIKYGNFTTKKEKAELKEIKDKVNAMGAFNKSLDDAEKFQKRVQGQTGVGAFGFLKDFTGAIPGMSKLSGMFDEAAQAAQDTAFGNEKNITANDDLLDLKKKQRATDLDALQSGKGFDDKAAERLGVKDKFKYKKDGGVNMSSFNKKNIMGKDGIMSKIKNPTLGIGEKLGTKSPLMAGLKKLGPALSKALGPIGILLEVLKGLMAADVQAVKLQKTMMLSSKEANSFNMGLKQAAMATGNISITGTKVFETFMSINKELGFIAKFSKETLGSATKLQKVLGISETSTANLAAASEATGTSLESNYENILGSSYELQMQHKTQIDMKAVLEETGQVTGLIRANLGGNVVEIAKAVTQAKLLGTNMKTVAAAGRQLLNFEQSISAEMNAELLTGRQLNLDRARAAALMGNQEVLAKELAANMGDFTSFSKLNVIQAEALAAAMGMTADQVADQLFNMETMNKTAKELRAEGKGELADRMEAKSVQDKMNAAMDQLKETFVLLGTTLLPIFKLLGFVASLFAIIIGYTQDLLSFIGNIFGIGDFAKVEDSAGTNAFKNMLNIGGGGTVEDAIIAPSGMGGKIITTSPADYLIATKDPGALVSSVGGNNGETNQLLKRLIGVVEAGGDVILDGNKVGRNLAIASSGIG